MCSTNNIFISCVSAFIFICTAFSQHVYLPSFKLPECGVIRDPGVGRVWRCEEGVIFKVLLRVAQQAGDETTHITACRAHTVLEVIMNVLFTCNNLNEHKYSWEQTAETLESGRKDQPCKVTELSGGCVFLFQGRKWLIDTLRNLLYVALLAQMKSEGIMWTQGHQSS